MSDDLNLAFASINDLAVRYRDGSLSPVVVTQACLDRIARIDPALNAFITVTDQEALAQAQQAEHDFARGLDRGPLQGVPIALKDLIDTAGVRTTRGSRLHKDHVPERDAALVTRLRAAGAVLVGKTNLLEFAYGVVHPDYGATRNPHNVARTAGGSSGGSAAAVAAGLCYGALGTDTGGSIRIPAAYCGVVGFKPSYGLVSTDGVFPLSWSLDHVGPIARSCRDAALLLAGLSGVSYGEFTEKVAGKRFGVLRRYLDAMTTEAGVLARFEAVLDTVRDAGATVVELDLPDLDLANGALLNVLLPEASLIHAEAMTSHADAYAPQTREQLELGFTLPATAYLRAQQYRRHLARQMRALFEEVDALLSPSVVWVAPAEDPEASGDEGAAEMHHSGPFNMTGFPALSLPCGLSDGLPVGLQVVTNHAEDGRCVAIAEGLEPLLPALTHPNIY